MHRLGAQGDGLLCAPDERSWHALWNAAGPELVFMIAVVAREDIYGDLHKVSAQLTDNQHLDARPKRVAISRGVTFDSHSIAWIAQWSVSDARRWVQRAIDQAADPMVHQYNFNIQYQVSESLVPTREPGVGV